MFSHIMLGVNDLERSIVFYDGVMSVLGYQRQSDDGLFAGYGNYEDIHTGINCLWIGNPSNGLPASHGNGTNVAFLASRRSIVDEFHRKAIELGGANEGDPGLRAEIHDDFYVAYVRDLDGNKLVVVCHEAEQHA